MGDARDGDQEGRGSQVDGCRAGAAVDLGSPGDDGVGRALDSSGFGLSDALWWFDARDGTEDEGPGLGGAFFQFVEGTDGYFALRRHTTPGVALRISPSS